jgi:cellulose synthase/poly-beta-1,6-N-acetylglucosamine synthase-like glycosyltransferase
MSSLLSSLLVALSCLIAVPVFTFFVEVLAALIMRQPDTMVSANNNDKRSRVCVLVPAHNESAGLLSTLKDLQKQLNTGDRLLVIADNCTDDTAAVAKAAGAEVAERHDPSKIGKGYALAWGIQQLRAEPPDSVVIIDADCKLTDNSLNRLVALSSATNRPVQSLNLMAAPEESSLDYRVSVFAFRVKNWVRPLGLRALNCPCQLMGTGMAFPWPIISSVDFATGALVEDIKLGLDLARTQRWPLFCPEARVDSQFPTTTKGAETQRTRWEQGHLGLIMTTAPSLIYDGLTQGNFPLLALALDMAVPPLVLLGMIVSVMLLICAVAALLGFGYGALILSAASTLFYASSLLLCWLKFGRDILPLRSFGALASYASAKFAIYPRMLSRNRQSQWVRTDRNNQERDTASQDDKMS